MTVTYIQYVPTAGKVGSFFRLLLLWRGGVLKGIWRDLVIYCILYTAISVGYRYGISQNEELKLNFERMCVYFGKNGDYIPLSFILGFYVTQVVTRWWGQFNSLAWPDSLAMNLLTYMPGSGKPRRLRRLIMRWVNLANILTLRRLSTEIARRFPSFEHLVESRLLTARELSKLNTVLETSDSLYPVHWVPLQWAQVELRKAKDDGHISSEEYIAEWENKYHQLKNVGCEHANMILAFKLLYASNLTEVDQKFVLTGVDYSTGLKAKTLINQIKESLKNTQDLSIDKP